MKKDFSDNGQVLDATEMPLGLGMQLSQEPRAMQAYGNLTVDQQARVIRYIQGGSSGDEAKKRIETAINQLKSNRIEFF